MMRGQNHCYVRFKVTHPVMWMRACAGKERRGSTHSLECIAHSKVRCISSEAAPNRSALAGIIINTGETPGKHRGNTGEKS